MQREECFELGSIARTRGLAGGLLVYLDVDNPEDYAHLDILFIEQNNTLIPYQTREYKLEQGNRVFMLLEDIDHIDLAKPLVGASLFLPLAVLPELEEDNFYYHDIIGYQVVDKNKGPLGTITSIYDAGHQDLLGMGYRGKEVLIPIVDDIVLKALKEEKILEVVLPDGLLEIYLDE